MYRTNAQPNQACCLLYDKTHLLFICFLIIKNTTTIATTSNTATPLPTPSPTREEEEACSFGVPSGLAVDVGATGCCEISGVFTAAKCEKEIRN